MPTPLIYLNGLFWPLDKANISVLDRGFAYGDGLFETFRAYSKEVFRLEDHLDRLFHSAHLIFLELPMTRSEIRSAIYTTMELNRLSDSIIRLTATRGEQDSGINIDHDSPPTIVIQARPVKAIPETAYEKGIAISLFKNSALSTQGVPNQIKSCNYLSHIILREKALKEGSFEGILLDHNNNVTEGTISNIFIIKNNELRTPLLNEFVLRGVTRQAVLDLALANNISCKEEKITEKELYEADELFITNSGIEILPVCKVNRCKFRDGKPGLMTKYIHKLFLKSFEESFLK